MPDTNAFAAIGFTNVSDYFAKPYPAASIPTDDWPFFYMVSRTYPVSYMIALGMVLALSYMFVRKTIGWSEPVERGYLPFSFWAPASCWSRPRPSPNWDCTWAARGS